MAVLALVAVVPDAQGRLHEDVLELVHLAGLGELSASGVVSYQLVMIRERAVKRVNWQPLVTQHDVAYFRDARKRYGGIERVFDLGWDIFS